MHIRLRIDLFLAGILRRLISRQKARIGKLADMRLGEHRHIDVFYDVQSDRAENHLARLETMLDNIAYRTTPQRRREVLRGRSRLFIDSYCPGCGQPGFLHRCPQCAPR